MEGGALGATTGSISAGAGAKADCPVICSRGKTDRPIRDRAIRANVATNHGLLSSFFMANPVREPEVCLDRVPPLFIGTNGQSCQINPRILSRKSVQEHD